MQNPSTPHTIHVNIDLAENDLGKKVKKGINTGKVEDFLVNAHLDDFLVQEQTESDRSNDSELSYHSTSAAAPEDFTTIHVHNSNTQLSLAVTDTFSNEANLKEYTDQHFINRLNEDLEKIRSVAYVSTGQENNSMNMINTVNHRYSSNSPLTLSNENSEIDSDNDSGSRNYRSSVHSNTNHHHKKQNNRSFYDSKSADFRNLTYQEIEKSLDKYYDEPDAKYSNELDVMITYLKGQKNLHIQSKNSCHSKLNTLFIPSLIIAAAITIFAPFIQSYPWSGGVISGLNALITMLISIANYYKLESAVEMFFHTANQYDKLETSLEFVASKMLFVQDDAEKSRIVLEKIQEIEKKVGEMKEWNSQFIPDEVRRMFPIICNINIFSFIKRMEAYKRSLVIKFKDIKNEIRYIMYRFSKMKNGANGANGANSATNIFDEYQLQEQDTEPDKELDQDACLFGADETRYNQRLLYLLDIKEKIKEELMYYRNAYNHIDELFTKEIKHAQRFNRCTWLDMQCNRYAFKHDPISNPVVDRYLHYLFHQ